jgi:hypothetical protein
VRTRHKAGQNRVRGRCYNRRAPGTPKELVVLASNNSTGQGFEQENVTANPIDVRASGRPSRAGRVSCTFTAVRSPFLPRGDRRSRNRVSPSSRLRTPRPHSRSSPSYRPRRSAEARCAREQRSRPLPASNRADWPHGRVTGRSRRLDGSSARQLLSRCAGAPVVDSQDSPGAVNGLSVRTPA